MRPGVGRRRWQLLDAVPDLIEPRNPALEAAIIADPDDLANYVVYGDWLGEQGHPRGELIAAQLAAAVDDTPAARRHAIAVLSRHREVLLGGLSEQLLASALTWHAGFLHRAVVGWHQLVHVDGARIDVPLADVLRRLLAHPTARLLAELAVEDRWGARQAIDYTAMIAEIAAAAPPTLRALSLGDLELDSHTNWGRLDALWPRVPRLRSLLINGKFRADAIALPALERATLRCFEVTAKQARAIAEAGWPQLRELTLIGGWNGADTHRHIPTLAANAPALTHLALVGQHSGDALLERLIGAGLIPRLTALDLRHSTLTDASTRVIAKHAAQFAGLARFDLTGCKLSAVGRARIGRSVPALVT